MSLTPEPGVELDIVVAESVYNYDVESMRYLDQYGIGPGTNPKPVSTDIKAAFQALWFYEPQEWTLMTVKGGYRCSLLKDGHMSLGYGKTEAHAICLALIDRKKK